jgi:cytochrome c oxidase subunit II
VTVPTLAPMALLQGFGGRMSALEPAGPQAERIQRLTWFLLAVATTVTVIVVVAALVAALRRRRAAPPTTEEERRHERTAARWVGGAVATTIVILLVFLGIDFATGRAMGQPAGDERPLTIEVIGRQWWWEVRYEDPQAGRSLTTANEIHVPVGRPVLLKLSSRDVIHSLWVPNLHGKKDLVPGHQTVTWFRADSAGVFRGQCAEFCGHQHAKMGLLVVADPPAAFAAWYERQLLPATEPADSVRQAGKQLFLTKGCVLCHAVGGTPAASRVGPDLTHVGSRLTIGAASLPNTRGHLAGWIVDPQRIKPGVRMPPNQLAPAELQALLRYLEGLQ